MSRKLDFNLGDFLPYQLAVLANRTSQAFSASYKDTFGFSIPEWRVMAHLHGQAHVSIREIHARVEMDKPKVSRAAQRLELMGYISKTPDADDKRLVRLALTGKGKKAMAQIAPIAGAFESAFLGRLTLDEQASFRHILSKLLQGDDLPNERT